jgi:uncharacterized protein YggU (UPF0235/DUF167 family)
MLIAVRVTPRGGRDGVDGWIRDAAGRLLLKVRVAAPAAEGQANAAVIAVLAKALGLPKSAFTLLSGQTARVKRIDVVGLSEPDLTSVFGSPPEV